MAHNVPSPLRQKVIADVSCGTRRRCRWRSNCRRWRRSSGLWQRGNGVALVPRLTVESELASGALVGVAVPELQVERKLRLVYRKQAALSHAARAFLQVVEEHAAEEGDPFCFVAEKG